MSTAEERLVNAGAPVHYIDFDVADEAIGGVLRAIFAPDGVHFRVLARLSLSETDRQSFAEWAEVRLIRFHDHGPEPDGWRRHDDQHYQLFAEKIQLPSLE